MTALTPPKDCHSMFMLRDEIDALDRQLVELLAVRSTYIDRAIELKQDNGWPARIPTRVEDVVSKVRAEALKQDLDADLVEKLWRQLIEWSIAREAKVIRHE